MTISRTSNSSLYNVNQGIVGAGNWARVTATTGSPTTGTYTDANGVSWKYYQWTANGSVTLTAGLVDMLLVGGGASEAGGKPGGSGYVRDGIRSFTSATHTVTIGSYGINQPGVLGPYSASNGGLSNGTAVAANVASSITGTSVTYAQLTGSTAGSGSTSGGGTVGTVIIRVPSAFALV